MIIDQLTLILGFSIILLAIIALLTSPFLCKIKSQNFLPSASSSPHTTIPQNYNATYQYSYVSNMQVAIK